MNVYVELPCGCQLTPTWVHCMCAEHFVEWRKLLQERERKLSEIKELIQRDGAGFYDPNRPDAGKSP